LFIDNTSGQYVLDPVAGHLHKADFKKDFKWKEHPRGHIVIKTNNLGFRNDSDTREEKPNELIRILVCGDSHTDGVVYNNESFPAVLEQMFDLNNTGKFEVLNGGVGYYGPQNYLGFIQKFIYLQPDVIVLVLYLGNDFLDAIHIAVERGELGKIQRQEEYYKKITQLDEIMMGFSGQCFNQAWYFKNFPQSKKTSLEIIKQNMRKIRSLSEENNAGLILVLLPSEIGSQFAADSTRILKAAKLMGMQRKEIMIENELADSLRNWLKEEKMPCIDLRKKIEKINRPLYWKKDLHLNVTGHQMLASTLYHSKVFQNSILY